MLTRGIPFGFCVGVHLPSLGQSRVYRVVQLRTDGIYCQESAGTRSVVVLKVATVSGAAFALYHHGPINVRLSFPTPTNGIKWACMLKVSEADIH